ncbi:cytochrome c [Ancylomarina subtilis]|uniref:Cytochrome c n=1 Tax=Ancylomarina subtilis TaxID=1639035 RepID=A0A4Q7VLJ4_9BACT|nr:cytochrome c [Ancylomarina subtilis]RZT97109.1 cytochrome c [Ancylomarina subtilis]
MTKLRFIFIILSVFSVFSCTNTEKKSITTNKTISKQEMELGGQIFRAKCMNCHKINGEGLKRTYPPLAKSDYLKNNIEDAVRMVKFGSSEKIKVNGVTYQSYMPESGLSDEDLRLVFNYILNSWGNEYGNLDLETIKAIKKKR